MRLKGELMDEAAMKRALIRIAYEISERNSGINSVALVGILRRGFPLALRIANSLNLIDNKSIAVPVGELDIMFYRDDFAMQQGQPIIRSTNIPFNITGKNIVLVDDVIYTARTAKAAIEALSDLGRPKSIQLAALVDRGHRELPIRADYLGVEITTNRNEVVSVNLDEVDGRTNVELYSLLD